MKAFLLIALMLPLTAHAEGFQVFGVKNDYPMADGEARFRDVYVNMGTNQGIKKGSTLDAFRTLTTVDDLNRRVGKNISFKVAKLKVIHAEPEIAVARVVSYEKADVTPTGTYRDVVVGDRVELGSK